MSFEKPRPRPRRSGVLDEEERAWVDFYRRVGREPAIAAEVLAQLDDDPEMKRAHLALYLRCRQSLGTQQFRQARHQRIGQFVRWLCHGLFVVPVQALHRAWHLGGDLAAECLPERIPVPVEPTLRPTRKATPRPKTAVVTTVVAAAPAAAGVEESSSRQIRPDAVAKAAGPAMPGSSAPGMGATTLSVVP
ncbi:hypothetical protein [Sphaerotilus sp.]|uniref:hypothetical protein n=1 Tax=Sphaerotilus sp. TaxID=2093942 RepID=UPI002ACD78D8|nr:hypothetical protein [Sphaerotilus sp.]MDZ7855753.1 hypothetical protein [Sphaerotilus sp.]